MVARLLSFLALAALLLMPLAPAAARPAATPSSMVMSGDEHCGGEAPGAPEKALPGAHCGAACALVMPEAGAAITAVPVRPTLPNATTIVPLDSLTPQFGTPPPRLG